MSGGGLRGVGVMSLCVFVAFRTLTVHGWCRKANEVDELVVSAGTAANDEWFGAGTKELVFFVSYPTRI
jgi:hypothetical protein